MPMLTTRQLCERYQVSRTTLTRWRESFGFPAPLKVGRTLRFDPLTVEVWVESRTRNEEKSA